MFVRTARKAIRYVTIHFQDRRGAASVRYKNRAEILLVNGRKSYPVWYCIGARVIRYSVNIARASVTINNRKTTHTRGVVIFRYV